MPLPDNITLVWVRGTLLDGDGEPVSGRVTLQPSPSALVDSAARQIIATSAPYFAVLDEDGTFAVEVPATDDSNVQPTGWTYEVRTPIQAVFHIVVPESTPPIDDLGDDLNGERVLELSSATPLPAPQSGTVQTLPPTPEDVAAAVDAYLLANPPSGLAEAFTHTQATPATVWGPIAHGFGRRPVAWSLYDTDDRECGGYEVQHLDLDTCRVSMDVPTAGVIRLL